MADNFNVSTTQSQANEAAGLDQNNPAMTYVDFANQIANNSQKQAEQAELVKQAQLTTQQRQAAAAQGINPNTKGYLSKDEALSLIQAELSRQNLLTDDVKAQLQNWYNTAPDMVEQQDVKDFISRYQPKEAKAGGAFVATTQDAANPSMFTKEGDHLVAGESYYDTGEKDDEGNAIYAHGGEIPRASGNGKEGQADEKSWQKLDAETNKFIRSSRGNSLSQAVQRANRALNELGEGQPLTSQVLSFIQKDLSGIFQGGMPPVSGMDSEDFTTVLQKVNQFIGKYTGLQGYLHSDLGNQRDYLVGILGRLRDSTVNMLKAAISSEASGYQKIVDESPDRWKQFVDDKLNAVITGLSQNAQTTLNAHNQRASGNLPPAMTPSAATPAATAAPAGAPNVDALANALGLKKKAAQ